MVGHIPHGGVVAALLLEQANQLGQHMVCVENGVVIGVGDGLATALLQLVGAADGCELLKLLGVALVVGGAVAALLVQHQQQVALVAFQFFRQILQQNLVETFAITAPARILGLAQILILHPITGALAAGIVVAPQHRNTGPLHHIQQALLVLAALVLFAAHGGEHAGHRGGGGGAAGAGLGEVDHIEFCQPGCGLALVAVETEVGGTGGFSHHYDKQGRFCMLLPERGEGGVQSDRLQLGGL